MTLSVFVIIIKTVASFSSNRATTMVKSTNNTGSIKMPTHLQFGANGANRLLRLVKLQLTFILF